jgi:hypothetical protein
MMVIFVPLFTYIDISFWQLALLAPVGLAGFAGGWTGGGKSLWVKDRTGLATVVATVPTTDAAIVRAKLKVATYSTVLTWAFTAAALAIVTVIALNGSIAKQIEAERFLRDTVQNNGSNQPLVLTACFAIALLIWTWKRTVNSHFNGLMGRAWIMGEVGLWVGAYFSLIIVVGLLFRAAGDTAIFRIAFALVGCRIVLSGLALFGGVSRGAMTARTAVLSIAAWLALAIGLTASFEWSLQDRAGRGIFDVAVWVVLIMPMTRLAALPLAVAWVRHR